jgi:hypothetical protein
LFLIGYAPLRKPMKESHKTFEENLKLLKKRNIVLAGRVEEHEIQHCWERCRAQNGQLTARKLLGEGVVRYVHSRHNPDREARQWARLIPQETEILTVLGFGLGYHTIALKKQNYRGLLIIIEADLGLFQHALGSVDLKPVLDDSRTHLFVQENPERIKKFLNHLNPGILRYRAYPPATDLYPDYYQTIRDMLEEYIFERRLQEAPALSQGIRKLLSEMIQ